MPSAHLGQKPDKKAKHSSQKKGVEEIEDAASVPAKLKSLTESLQSMLNSGQKSKSRVPHVSAKDSAAEASPTKGAAGRRKSTAESVERRKSNLAASKKGGRRSIA